MAKSKKRSAESKRLEQLITTYGMDAVMAATGWKIGTINNIVKGYQPTIAARLDIAEKVLASNI